jgi:hypothetical protein
MKLNFVQWFLNFKSRDSSVGIALGYGLDDRGSRFRIPAGAGKFSLHHRVQNFSAAHPASYPVGTRGSFPRGTADHSPPSSAKVKKCMELYLHSPNTPSWRDAPLHSDYSTPVPLPYEKAHASLWRVQNKNQRCNRKDSCKQISRTLKYTE